MAEDQGARPGEEAIDDDELDDVDLDALGLDVERIDAALADLRTVLLQPASPMIAAAHQARMVEAARAKGDPADAGVISVPLATGISQRMRRTIAVVGAGLAALVGVGGLGVAGALPGPVQDAVATITDPLGLDLPRSDDAPATPAGERPATAPGQVGDPSATAPGQVGGNPSATAPGQVGGNPSATAPGQSGDSPSATAPGQSGDSPFATAPGRSGESPSATAPGRSGDSPSATAPGQSGGGSSGTRPTVTTPPKAQGQGADAAPSDKGKAATPSSTVPAKGKSGSAG